MKMEIVIRIINNLIELILISGKDLVNKAVQGQRHALRLLVSVSIWTLRCVGYVRDGSVDKGSAIIKT
jgi:hypothetical protein